MAVLLTEREGDVETIRRANEIHSRLVRLLGSFRSPGAAMEFADVEGDNQFGIDASRLKTGIPPKRLLLVFGAFSKLKATGFGPVTGRLKGAFDRSILFQIPDSDWTKLMNGDPVDWSDYKPTFIHELVHFLDFERRDLGTAQSSRDASGLAGYYNNPAELQAYSMEILDRVKDLLLRHDVTKEKMREEGAAWFVRWTLNFVRKSREDWADVWSHLTAANRERFIKRATTFFQHVVQPEL